MSTEAEHSHAFRRDTTSLCRCGMTAGEYEQLRADEAAGRPHAAETSEELEIAGQVIITWPSSKTFKGYVPAAGFLITDVESGQNILTVTDLRVVVGFNTTEMAIVELTTHADAEGNPILFGTPTELGARMSLADDGNARTATTWWHVAEMRVGK